MKHNKGPWKIIVQSKGLEVFSSVDETSICEMSADDNQSMVNAHLIAAAPEMLDALKMLSSLQGFKALLETKYSLPLVQDILSELNAAIKKAKGE